MNEFTRKIISGNTRALMFAKSLLTDPGLAIKINGTTIYIPLEVEICQQTGDAVVSEQLVVTPEGKKYITDNVAPGQWSWNISGYLSGVEFTEPTNFFKPSVKFQTDIIRKTYKDGLNCSFKDIDCMEYKNVFIQSLTIETRSECKNKKPFQMVLKQVEVLESSEGEITRLKALSTPPAGDKNGLPAEYGQGGTTTVDLKSIAYEGGEKAGIF